MYMMKKINYKLYIKKGYKKTKPYVITFLNLALIIWLYSTFGGMGLLYFAGVVVIILLVRGWKYRQIYVQSLREMEEHIFGKPLDKSQWDKGELKNTKVKVVWRKNKNGKEKRNNEVSEG